MASSTPAEIKTLQKIFKLLGLDPESVSKVHSAATEPVAVAPTTAPGQPRYTIPPPPASEPVSKPRLQLDPSKVAALKRDSERVAGILAAAGFAAVGTIGLLMRAIIDESDAEHLQKEVDHGRLLLFARTQTPAEEERATQILLGNNALEAKVYDVPVPRRP